MARQPGSRNADYERTRAQILERLRDLLFSERGPTASFRELAQAAEVSPATLRHYFHDRVGLLSAAYASFEREGLRYQVEAAMADHGPVEDSLRWFLGYLVQGWMAGVGRIHRLGLAAGLVDPVLGPGYLEKLLEPLIEAGEARLARHVAAQELGPCQLRHASLELLAPLILVLLHQRGLGGDRTRPLEVSAFIEDHLQCFLRAHRAPAEATAARPARRRRAQPRA